MTSERLIKHSNSHKLTFAWVSQIIILFSAVSESFISFKLDMDTIPHGGICQIGMIEGQASGIQAKAVFIIKM